MAGRQARRSRARSEPASGARSEAKPSGDESRNEEKGRARVEIRYCARCRFLARAAWTAQELLTTFADEMGELALVPGENGVFQVYAGGEQLWCRKKEGRFPELAELKQRVRDRIAPGKSLGHSDASE